MPLRPPTLVVDPLGPGFRDPAYFLLIPSEGIVGAPRVGPSSPFPRLVGDLALPEATRTARTLAASGGDSRTGRFPSLKPGGRGSRSVQRAGTIARRPSGVSIPTASRPKGPTTTISSPQRGWTVNVVLALEHPPL